MQDSKTWFIITDADFIKIMVHTGTDRILRPFRDADYESSSELTYRLITRDRKVEQRPGMLPLNHFIELLVKELRKYRENGAFDRLVLVAPGDLAGTIRAALPEELAALIVEVIAEDHLKSTLDVMEQRFAALLAA